MNHPLVEEFHGLIKKAHETCLYPVLKNDDTVKIVLYSQKKPSINLFLSTNISGHEKMALEKARKSLEEIFKKMRDIASRILKKLSSSINQGYFEILFSKQRKIDVFFRCHCDSLGFDSTKYLTTFFNFSFDIENFESVFIRHLSAILNRGNSNLIWRTSIKGMHQKNNEIHVVPMAYYNFYAKDEARAHAHAQALAFSISKRAFGDVEAVKA